MKFTTVWKFFPVFITKSKDGWAHASGPVIKLPDDCHDVVVKHELFHVKQFYALLLPALILCIALPLLAVAYLPITSFWAISLFTYAPVGLVILTMVWWNSDFLRYRRECAAYGESLRNLKTSMLGQMLQSYAFTLSANKSHYDFDVTKDEAAERIAKRHSDGRLI